MWHILKTFLRLLFVVSIITIVPFVLWWVFTGLGFYETIDEIELIDW
jgi:hypothetical protein